MVVRLLSFLLIVLAGAAPGATRIEGGSFLRADDHRVAVVAYRLATRGIAHCPTAAPATGLQLHHLGEYASGDRAAAAARFGVDKGPGILSVVAGSPAERAGLAAGDVLIAANGHPFPSPATAAAEPNDKKRRRLIEQSEAMLDDALRQGPAELRVLRGEGQRVVTLEPRRGCRSKARLARSGQANAFADGTYAIMTTKMLAFIRSEDELAVAMAHEMAHNILGHPAELEAQGVPHGILRGFGKNAQRVRATETAADRLGMKLLWSAGFDVDAAIPFWRRLYAAYDPIPVPKFLRTHPSLGARERLIEEMLIELKDGPGPSG